MKIGYLMQAGVPDLRDRPLSGPANHVKHVVFELQKLGHEVRLVAQLDGQFWVSNDLESFERISIKRSGERLWHLFEKVIRRVQSTFHLPYAAWFESQRFSQACRQELDGFDLLYERMGWMGYGGAIASNSMGIPWILEVNGDHLDELASLGMAPVGGQKWLSMAAMQWAVRQADHVVAVGEGWKHRFLERWSVDSSKVSVVENGSEMVEMIDPLAIFDNEPRANRSVKIVYVGGFEPWHGVLALVKAMAMAVEHEIDATLELIGDGSELGAVKKLISGLNLESVVSLVGYLPMSEVAPYLANADIGVCPYCGRANFSGLKILDYKAAGLATIASGQNDEPAILEHGKTGWLVPPGDVDALAEALIYLASEEDLRHKIGQAARKEAEEKHRWRHTAIELEDLFLRLPAAADSI